MKRNFVIYLILTSFVVIISCEQENIEPEEQPLLDISGTYCTILFNTLNTPASGYGFNLKIDYITDSTIVLIGNFQSYIDSIFANINNNNIIIPEQEFFYTELSPGGTTYTEYTVIYGDGQYDPERHWISFEINSSADFDYRIEGIKDEYLDLTGYYTPDGSVTDLGHRRPPSEDDRLRISNDPISDSLLINFTFNYIDHVDSTLQNFKIPYEGCINKVTILIDSINSLDVYLFGNSDYMRLRVDRISTVPFGYYNSYIYTNFYQFGGVNTN